MKTKLLNFFAIGFIGLTLFSCTQEKQVSENTDLTKYVDPFIGTGYHGHVFLGANVPFGAIQVGPTNFGRGWDWCSGYHYSDSIMVGFAQTHLSGTGIGDLGDILITPYVGEIKSNPGSEEKPEAGYASKYTHNKETAEAGYYSVDLLRYNIKAELTATERTAFHNYTFPKSKQSHIAINLNFGIGWDAAVKSKLTLLNDSTIIGYRFSKGWAVDQRIYYAIRLSKPVKDLKLFRGDALLNTTTAEKDSLVGVISFPTAKNETVMLKVGISPVSEENALNNLNTENPEWNFEEVKQLAKAKWNKQLSKIEVESLDDTQLRTFYTALFHAYIAPCLFNDVNKDYRGTDKKVYKNADFNNYTVFSLWDTYRAAHPLFTITHPKRVSDMVKSMLAISQQQGKLPIWALNGNETNCMVGYSAVPVITDAIFKGIKGIDKELALQAMVESSMRDDHGLKYLKEKGYIPADKEPESVSKALEYAISDWCIAQLADSLDNKDIAKIYNERAQAYRRYFDKKTQFMRPIMNDGSFKTPFDPFNIIHETGDYTEGNAWQYTWLVPQDVDGLINLFGSKENFIEKLDSLFVVSGNMGTKASPDVSGLIGMYAQGNEPSHHIPYLYALVGEQWKTAKLVRRIVNEMYTDKPDGLCGNEDCGQMSAWYVLSAMGFYQVNPADGKFVFGSPLFDKATIKLENGKTFTITAKNQSKENAYIKSATLNGKRIDRPYINYQEIMNGGELVFEMSPDSSSLFPEQE